MTKDETPTPGPELDSVYQPGTPGAPWTRGEVMLTMLITLITLMPMVLVLVELLVMRLVMVVQIKL